MAVARELLADYREDGRLTMRHWRGGWMRWDRTCWQEIEDAAVRAWVYVRLKDAQYEDDRGVKPWNPNRRRVSDVLDALAATTHLAETTDPPAWLSGSAGDRDPGEIVACTNGLLHVGTRDLLPLNPRYFNRVAVPFDYDPAVPEPAAWLKFLGELWPDDPASIDLLREFFGYVLSGRTDMHKILLIVGPTRSGKGTIARVLAALIGKGNVAGPTLASLGTNFGLAPLLGKPLALVSDARLGNGDAHQVVERLLSVSGEDMLTIDRKYREPWTGKLPARFVVLSNELPRFGDASGAIAHRFVVLNLAHSWLGREDRTLTGKLLAELPGILAWALDGLDQLAANGSFTEPQASVDAITALQDLVSPTSAFVRDECDVGVAHEVLVDDLFGAWKSWCDENGRARPGTVQSFGRDLRAVVPGLKVIRGKEDGVRSRRYAGVKLNGAHNGEDRGPTRTRDGAAPDTPESGSLGPRGSATPTIVGCTCGRDDARHASGDWGPCVRCGTRFHSTAATGCRARPAPP